MKPYENVYEIENGALVKNTENKLEYTDKNGVRRTKTNPTLGDFIKNGKFPLSDEARVAFDSGKDISFFERNGEIYPIKKEVRE